MKFQMNKKVTKNGKGNIYSQGKAFEKIQKKVRKVGCMDQGARVVKTECYEEVPRTLVSARKCVCVYI